MSSFIFTKSSVFVKITEISKTQHQLQQFNSNSFKQEAFQNHSQISIYQNITNINISEISNPGATGDFIKD